MRVLSLDPALLNTGWSFFSDDKLSDFGVISSTEKRLILLRNHNLKLLKEIDIDLPNNDKKSGNLYDRGIFLKYSLQNLYMEMKPDTVVSEIQHGTQNYRGALYFGIVLGIIYSIFPYRPEFITSFQCRKYLNIYSDKAKDAVISWCIEKYQIQCDKDNWRYLNHVCDSILVYETWRNRSLR